MAEDQQQSYDSNDSHPSSTSLSQHRMDVGYLGNLPDGCGCVEVWEHLSERRTEGADNE